MSAKEEIREATEPNQYSNTNPEYLADMCMEINSLHGSLQESRKIGSK